MNRLSAFVMAVYRSLGKAGEAYRLFVRLAVGLMYFGGALIKLGKLDELAAYLASLGVPAAKAQAPFIAGTELVASALLLIGLATRPAAVALSVIMVVAITTAGVTEHHLTATWKGLLDLLYLSDWLLLLILIGFVLTGAGSFSLDHAIARGRGSPPDA